MSIYYVYQYLRSDGTPYYIGKGHGNRAYDKHISIHVPKDKTKIVFLHENMTEEDSFVKEIELIKHYGRKDLGTGILRNRTNGGEGVSGYKFTDEQRAKLTNIMNSPEVRAKKYAGMKNHWMNPETRAKRSIDTKNRFEDLEFRAKMTAAQKKRRATQTVTKESREKQSSSMKISWRKRKSQNKVL